MKEQRLYSIWRIGLLIAFCLTFLILPVVGHADDGFGDGIDRRYSAYAPIPGATNRLAVINNDEDDEPVRVVTPNKSQRETNVLGATTPSIADFTLPASQPDPDPTPPPTPPTPVCDTALKAIADNLRTSQTATETTRYQQDLAALLAKVTDGLGVQSPTYTGGLPSLNTVHNTNLAKIASDHAAALVAAHCQTS